MLGHNVICAVECENKGCEQICLNVDGSKGQCTCATGYALQPDGISCQGQSQIVTL